MNELDLIGAQSLKIEELEKSLFDAEDRLRKIASIMYCCAGPLNGNLLGYNSKQLVTFSMIAELTES